MAGFLGALQGVAGMLSAGGFWRATSNDSLTRAMSDLTETKQKMNDYLQKEEGVLLASQKEYYNDQIKLMQTIEQSHDEIMEEQIGKNALVIQIVVILLAIVIIYLLVL